MKLIAINGAKNSKKDLVAMRLAQNKNCIFIKPYTDKRVLMKSENYDNDEYIHLNTSQLLDKMEREEPLTSTRVGTNRYVFFKNQLRADYVVLIGDDNVISYLKNNWDGDLTTVMCHSVNEKPSNRCRMSDDEFDFVFNYESDDYGALESELL